MIMRFNIAFLAVTAIASAAAAVPEAASGPWMSGVAGAYNVKRAAFAINDILKRHASVNPMCSQPAAFCERQRQRLDDVAEAAVDGYEAVSRREATADAKLTLPWKTHSKRNADGKVDSVKDLIGHCDNPGAHCARNTTAENAVKRLAKRHCDLCYGGCTPGLKAECHKIAMQNWHINHPHPHGGHPKSKNTPKPPSTSKLTTVTPWQDWCGAPGSGACAGWEKRDRVDAEPFSKAILAIRDVVQQIKRDGDAERVEESPDDHFAEIPEYFQVLEERLSAAVAEAEA